jgi:hypothetical protein
MERAVETLARGIDVIPVAPRELQCRVCELEEENTRLRLLVSELLVANQQLRERARVAAR